jgi:hypothetical protein
LNWREDKTLLILCAFTFFFTMVTLSVVWLRPTDGQTYQTCSGLLTGFAGALMMHLKGEKVPPAGSTTDVQTHQVVKIPPETAQEVPKS